MTTTDTTRASAYGFGYRAFLNGIHNLENDQTYLDWIFADAPHRNSPRSAMHWNDGYKAAKAQALQASGVTRARELAQQLRAVIDENSYKSVLPTSEEKFFHKHGVALADTLTALVDKNARLCDVLAGISAQWAAIQKLQDEEPGHGEPDNWRCWRKELNGKTSLFDDLITSLMSSQTHVVPDVDAVPYDSFAEWAAEDGSALDAMALPVESEGGELD